MWVAKIEVAPQVKVERNREEMDVVRSLKVFFIIGQSPIGKFSTQQFSIKKNSLCLVQNRKILHLWRQNVTTPKRTDIAKNGKN